MSMIAERRAPGQTLAQVLARHKATCPVPVGVDAGAGQPGPLPEPHRAWPGLLLDHADALCDGETGHRPADRLPGELPGTLPAGGLHVLLSEIRSAARNSPRFPGRSPEVRVSVGAAVLCHPAAPSREDAAKLAGRH